MSQFLAVCATVAAVSPLAIVAMLMLMREGNRQLPMSRKISFLAIGVAGSVFAILAIELFLGIQTVGFATKWIVETYPSVIRSEAQAPVTFIVSAVAGAIAVVGLYGVVTAYNSEVKRGLYFFVLAIFAVVGLYEITSGALFIGSRWLGQSVWPIELVANYFPPIFGVAVGVAATVLILSMDRSARNRHEGHAVSLNIILIFFVVAFGVAALGARAFFTASGDIDRLRSLPVNVVQLSLPDNFVITEMTPPETFRNPSALDVREDGVIFVATSDGIFTVHIEDEDSATVRKFSDLSSATGIHWYEGRLLVAVGGKVIAIADEDHDTVAEKSEVLIRDLPSLVYSFHSNNGLIVNSDLRLLMTIGGTSDHGPETSDIAGSVISTNLDGSDLMIVAKGLRNAYGITDCPDGDIYVSDNGPDQIDDRLMDFPPDEINRIIFGMDYGYPDTFGYPAPHDESEPPVALLPERAGAAGLICYDGNMFPSDFSGDLFVALWGTLSGSDYFEGGRKVVRVELETVDGAVRGTVSTFATGFGHPVDVVVHVDGSLLILDFEVGQIFQISYVPD